MGHTLYLPAWSIGPDCYNEVYDIARPYGKKAAVIGGKTAMSIAVPELKKALEGTDLELTEPIWFGGEASYENAAMLEAMPEVKDADMIFAIGGGSPMLLTRGVLYTAITRARELLLLVGNEELIAQMTQNNRRNKRYSGLRFRLQGEA